MYTMITMSMHVPLTKTTPNLVELFKDIDVAHDSPKSATHLVNMQSRNLLHSIVESEKSTQGH